MGDAIMAFWNAPLDDSDHATHAVESALAMRQTLVTLNEGWRKRAEAEGRSFKPVRFGIGLNTGECCVGNLGSLRRFDYSAIGDEVNVASRLEGACKIFSVDVIGSEPTRAEAPEFAWLEINSVLVKGKTQPVGLYALAGDAALAASEEFAALTRLHSSMLGAYRNRDFAGAIAMAKEAATLAPEAVRGLTRTTCAASANWPKRCRTRTGVRSSPSMKNSRRRQNASAPQGPYEAFYRCRPQACRLRTRPRPDCSEAIGHPGAELGPGGIEQRGGREGPEVQD